MACQEISDDFAESVAGGAGLVGPGGVELLYPGGVELVGLEEG